MVTTTTYVIHMCNRLWSRNI